MRIREAGGIADVGGGIGTAGKLNGHAESAFTFGNALYAINDFIAALGHFAAELLDEIIGVVSFELFEFLASVIGDAPGDESDRDDDGEGKNQREFETEAHRVLFFGRGCNGGMRGLFEPNICELPAAPTRRNPIVN